MKSVPKILPVPYPEYCGRRYLEEPRPAKAVKAKIEAEEEHFDFDIPDRVVAEATNIDIPRYCSSRQNRTWWKENRRGFGPENDVILGILFCRRTDDRPLKVEGVDVSLPVL